MDNKKNKKRIKFIKPINTIRSMTLECGRRKLFVWIPLMSPNNFDKVNGPEPNSNSVGSGLYLAINIPQSSDLLINNANVLTSVSKNLTTKLLVLFRYIKLLESISSTEYFSATSITLLPLYSKDICKLEKPITAMRQTRNISKELKFVTCNVAIYEKYCY